MKYLSALAASALLAGAALAADVEIAGMKSKAPAGLEAMLDHLDVVKGMPISLPLSLVVLLVAALVYRLVVNWQGALLTAREQKVLEVVTSRAE